MKKLETDDNELAVDAKALERYEGDNSSALAIRTIDDIKRLSSVFITSGMFKGDKSLSQVQQLSQACVKIVAGIEFGIQPFAAVRGINIIKGNAEMSANLMAAKVKKHPKYDYRVKKWDRDGCVLEFYEIPRSGAPRSEWELLGESSFDAEDAKIAGLASGDNWRKFARNMYFARAMSNGVRIYTPDVFYGAPVYVEGEISGEFEDAPTTDTSGPISAKATPETPTTPPTSTEDVVEGEVVDSDDMANDAPTEVDVAPADDQTADPALERQLASISTIAKKLGYGDDWILDAHNRAASFDKAATIIAKLKGEQARRAERNSES